ncbi:MULTISPECIES: type II toxin-antitoxin system HicB family antitoxin [Pasteurellaceae]|uniref:Type II toxin-antitoxin system HicB family antitoxin n=1 Tax=Pasteurella atlantica TaxID=2827233 RepID=A0AAW8CKV7_9PAST|nr:type II toxin-antitoxin system HicB family antitoxin [Pasteurella atlantica]MBR0574208.1 type II toxin-antitoxin system HicB family antitoxin [Pasteurella atlantica]MDP8039317.1 type II toxin-antitoxin system HicB family antitoxin [Pasteurella atlantica]MDP8041409.1 type II toxin-antitoxin system HicB family antitoxin [Pasteurella atlantica]MDP8043545.1 type II toxin-antitoxin system HicB family antitoxin [Pasteurella atlantica]MDP8045537.1 type II toxin-antitoxin system HicB family antitox
MLFTIGVEMPKDENSAFGMVVPALCNDEYSCFSAADSEEEIIPQVTDAVHSMLELMLDDDFDILSITDKGFNFYKTQEDYKYCDVWLLIDIDLTSYFGNRKRLNISLPQYLIDRIDSKVSHSDIYRDRSHFLAVASQKELGNRI